MHSCPWGKVKGSNIYASCETSWFGKSHKYLDDVWKNEMFQCCWICSYNQGTFHNFSTVHATLYVDKSHVYLFSAGIKGDKYTDIYPKRQINWNTFLISFEEETVVNK